jgi:subtilisin-like proprotein convertase family protein
VGTHTLFASYAAQGAFGGSSATASLVVSKGVPTFTATSPSVAAGQTPVVLSGTLKAGSAVPTGSVSITLDGVTQTATPNPSSGAFSSTFATGTLPAGAHPVTLAYAGDANFEAASGEATLYVVPAVLTTTFANPAAITINDFAPGSPSPSVISVSGLFGKVLKATVTLRGLTHTFVGDTAFLLVGPDGTSTVLLYHVGGSSSVSGLDLAFDDAGDPVPAVMAAGTYRPTQTGLVSSFQTGGAPGPDPPPAPYGTTLFAHNGAGPNGDWRLYAQDDSGSDSGSVASGWELTLTTAIEPAASIDDVVVAEGGDAVFTVSLSSPPAFPVDVDYATAAGTATAGADFVTASGTVRFDPLQTSQALTVATVPDAEAEPAETFYVDLTSPVNATLLDAQGMGTITDDDPHATLADVEKPEGHAGTTSFVFTVTLTAPPGVPVSVAYSTAPLTATPGRDYTAVSGVLTFAAGETSGRITVPVVADRIEEQDELFKVVLSGPSGLFIDRPEALGRIVNDDFVGLPKISIYDASLVEGDSGSANMVFTVRMSRVSSTVVTLRYATASGTAVAGSDYAPTGGTLFFPIGVKERTVSVPVIGDLLDEPTEAFFVNLSAPRGAALLDGQAKGAILDDDP